MKWSEVKVAQSCPTICDPMDYTVHGILQARILGWVAFPFSRGSSQPRVQTQVSCIAGGFCTSWATRESHHKWEQVKLGRWINSRSIFWWWKCAILGGKILIQVETRESAHRICGSVSSLKQLFWFHVISSVSQ